MRVLCVSSQLPCLGVQAGGGRVFQILRGLSRNHEIDLLAFVSREAEREHLPALRTFCRRVEVVLRGQAHGLPNPFGLRPPYFFREWGNPELGASVAAALGSGRYDVLLVEFLEATCVLPRVLRIPSVLTHHEVQYATLLRLARYLGPFDRTRWKAWANAIRMVRYEREACARFDKVFTMSDEDAAKLRRFVPRLPIEVSSMGVDPAFFAPRGEPEEENALVFTAYYEHRPNTDAAVFFVNEILPKIRREVPGARLYLVGSHPSPEVLALGEVEGVVVTGRVPDLRPWLERASVFVAPLRLGRGMRGKVLEAMAMGRPVVTTSVGAAGFDLEENRNAFVADDPTKFAAKTVRLLRDRALRDRIGSAGRALVLERYTWDVQVERYDRAFRDLGERAEGILRKRGVALPRTPEPWREAPGRLSSKAFWPLGGVYLLLRTLGFGVEGALEEGKRESDGTGASAP